MTIYVEFAFLENFLLDGILLFFAVRYSGCQWRKRGLFSAAVGGVSAVVYPLFSLSPFWSGVYKIAVGIALPLLAVGKEKGKKTGLCVALFFAFSFLIAGGVYAFTAFLPVKEGYFLEKIPLAPLLGLLLAAFAFLAETLSRIKRRRERTDFYVQCEIEGERATGFIDTGNQARRFGKPICFVAPTIFERVRKGKKTSDAYIATVAGEKKISVVKIQKLSITSGGQTHIVYGAYLSPSSALYGREYEVLLGAWACA